MSETYYQWRVHCNTDNVDRHWILADDDPVPTACPDNTAHSIDPVRTVRTRTISDKTVKIQEESTETGGHFTTATIRIDALRNATTTKAISWPHPIGALSMNFVTTEEHRGDFITQTVGKDTIIGVITSNVVPAIAWISQNYIVGQTVTYTDPVFGARVYTCTTDTTSNQAPTDKSYWRHGLRLSVSPTVIQYADIGFYLKLDNFVTNDDLGKVLYKDIQNNHVYVQNNPSNTYIAGATYVRQTVYTMRDYEISSPWEHEVGQSKIGASYVPADTLVEISYTNGSTGTDKVFVVRVDYLY